MQGWKQSPHSQAFVCQQTSGAKTGFFSHRRTRPPKKRSQTKTDIQILNKNSNFWNEEFFGMSSYLANCLSLPCVFVDLGVHTRYGRLRASTHGMHKVLQLFDSEQHHDWQQAHAVETLFGWKLAKIKATQTASVMEMCGLVKLVGKSIIVSGPFNWTYPSSSFRFSSFTFLSMAASPPEAKIQRCTQKVPWSHDNAQRNRQVHFLFHFSPSQLFLMF